MSKSVFISHAVKDKDLVKEIVDLIEEGMGVPEEEIFCSSLNGYGIPSGRNFVTYIKEQLLEPKVVILVLTPAYFESKFCLSELGAAWIKSHEIFPILVPPLKYSDVKDVLLGTQVAKVDDDIKYNELFETLIVALAFAPKSRTKWDTKRRAFLKALGPILSKTAGPTVVAATDYQEKINQLAEAQAELDASEGEIRRLKERLAATEALKDRDQVAALGADDHAEVAERFDALADEIKEFKSVLRSREVMKFVLCDHYDKPYKIDWYWNREEFEAAARFGFIALGDGERVIWSKRQMKSLKAKLDELDGFVAEHGKELQAAAAEFDTPLDPEDQDFWEFHYEL